MLLKDGREKRRVRTIIGWYCYRQLEVPACHTHTEWRPVVVLDKRSIMSTATNSRKLWSEKFFDFLFAYYSLCWLRSHSNRTPLCIKYFLCVFSIPWIERYGICSALEVVELVPKFGGHIELVSKRNVECLFVLLHWQKKRESRTHCKYKNSLRLVL